jgi:hypothetical protein
MFRLLQILGTLAVNAIPLAGVLWFGWHVFEVLLVYWFENLAIGIFHAARLDICTRTNAAPGGWGTTAFFALHYGIFTLVHGVFVFVYFGVLSDGILASKGGLSLPVLSVFGWQALQLALDTMDTQRFKGRDPNTMMFEPYPRVFALHVAVILGGFLIGEFGAPIWALAALVAVKTLCDLFFALVFAPGAGTPAETPGPR